MDRLMKKIALLLIFALTLGMLFSCSATGGKDIAGLVADADAHLEKGPYKIITRVFSPSFNPDYPLEDAVITVDGDKIGVKANIDLDDDKFYTVEAVIIDGVCYADYLSRKVKIDLTDGEIAVVDLGKLDISALVSDFTDSKMQKEANKISVSLTGSKKDPSKNGLAIFRKAMPFGVTESSCEIEFESGRYKSITVKSTYQMLNLERDFEYKFTFSYSNVSSVELPADANEYVLKEK